MKHNTILILFLIISMLVGTAEAATTISSTGINGMSGETNAIDGDYSTATGAGQTGNLASGSSYMLVTLDRTANVTNITMKVEHYQAGGGLSYVDLQYSVDGSSWTTIMTNSTSDAALGMINQSTYNVNAYARYIRSSMWTNNIQSNARWYEIQINTSTVVVGNWTFDQASGNYVNDSSGFNNNGTIYNATWATNLVNGSVNSTGLSLDGDYDYVNLGSNSSLNVTNAMTFSGWINTADTKANQFVAGHGNTGFIGWFVSVTNGSSVRLTVGNGAATAYGINTYQMGQWAYITGVYNSTYITMYVNGVAGTPTAQTGTIDYTGVSNTTLGIIEGVGGTSVRYFNGTIDEVKLYNYALNQSEITAEYQQFHPVPSYPVGGITLTGTYPPLTTSVNFSWHDTEYSSDRLIISRDSGFNTVVHDGYYTTDYANVALAAGIYYWKVVQYDSATGVEGDTSSTQTFTLSTTTPSSDGTAGIQGTVYETSTSGNTPLSDVRVVLYNSTYFTETTTGSNGYFVFTGLANISTYTIQATKKNYDNSEAIPVQTINGTWVTQNINMVPCTSSWTCNVNQQFVKFTVQSLFGTKYTNVEANIYKGNEVTALDTADTDVTGSVNFWLIKDQEYRLTFINTSQGINREITIIASDTEYLVIISGTGTAWQQYTTQVKDAIYYNVTKQKADSTNAFINITYQDSLNETTSLIVFINQTNTSDPYNQTVISSWTASAPMNNTNHSFTLSNYEGQQYIVHFLITHSTYGTVHSSYSVTFTKSMIPSGVSSTLLLWFSVVAMVITGAVFTGSTAELGLIIVSAEGWIFLAFGFLDDLNTTQVEIGLTVTTVLGVIAYVVMKSKREGYS